MEATDTELIKAVLAGDTSSFEPLVEKYQDRVFGTARKYAGRESDVQDIVQDICLKAFQNLNTFRGQSPFEHWLMRLTDRTCYDHLGAHQRNREQVLAEITEEEAQWLERVSSTFDPAD